jgi:hypothetical protein
MYSVQKAPRESDNGNSKDIVPEGLEEENSYQASGKKAGQNGKQN